MSVTDGPDGEVYLPAVYATDEQVGDPFRLGRETDWRQMQDGPVRGIGQRLFLIGEDALPIMDLHTISFGRT
jgi:type VI secretion system protein ImpE